MPENRIWEFNKGEWSEAYVFLKLLADGRIYAADESAARNLNTYIDIIDILRFDKQKEFKYVRKSDDGSTIIEAYRSNDRFYVVTAPELEDKAAFLFRSIRDARPEQRRKTFTVTELQSFLEEFGFSSPKVSSIPRDRQNEFGKKADIIITLKDSIDGQITKEGFSIKSRLGSNPTLFNAAPSSGLIYEVEGCTEELMHKINILEDFSRKMIPAVKENGLNLKFVGTYRKNGIEMFRNNIMLVESTMPEILGKIMLYQCGFISRTGNSSSELTAAIANENPSGVAHPENYYMTKLKSFHFATFAGMTASEEWDGRPRLSGGFIDVTRDGDLLYYRALSDDVFISYLFDHLYFDRPDRGYKLDIAVAKAKAYFEGRELTEEELHDLEYEVVNGRTVKRNQKCDWGYIYEKEGKYYISINFQTRFR